MERNKKGGYLNVTMCNKKLLLVLALFLMSPMLISALDPSFTFRNGDNATVSIPIQQADYSQCADCNCNLSITYPNGTSLIQNQNMSFIEGYATHTLNSNQTSVNGEYSARVVCDDGSNSGFSTFIYEVNPTGIKPTDQRTQSITTSLYFIFGIAVLLFVAFLFTKQNIPVKWTFFIGSILFFLIGINLVLVGLQGAVVDPRLETFFDGFTAISWILYWFMAGLLIIMWIFTFLNTWLLKKNMRNFQKFGGGGGNFQ